MKKRTTKENNLGNDLQTKSSRIRLSQKTNRSPYRVPETRQNHFVHDRAFMTIRAQVSTPKNANLCNFWVDCVEFMYHIRLNVYLTYLCVEYIVDLE